MNVKDADSDFKRFMTSSERGVLSIRLVDELSSWLSRVTRRTINAKWIIWILILFAPVISFALFPLGFHCQEPTLYWLLYYVIVNYLGLIFPRDTWAKLVELSDNLDEMLATSQNRTLVISYVKRRLRLPPQIAFSLFGGVAGMIASAIAEYFLAGALPLCPASYVSVFLTSVLGFNSVYWLWAATLLIHKLYLLASLSVTWNAPIGTPGIRNLSRLMGTSAIKAFVGLFLFMIPITWSYFFLPSREYLLYINILAFGASLATLLFVVVFPQYWLSAIAYREKHRILDELGTEIDRDRLKVKSGKASGAAWSNLETKINIYQSLASTSTFPTEAATAASYLVAVITTLLPFIVQWLLP